MARAMTARRLAAASCALVAAATLAGCGIGTSSDGGGASLTVTRDFGSRLLVRARESKLPRAETAMRILQRNARVDTRYGGRFVTAIDGLRSSVHGARRSDWFYFVNGIEADVSAAEKRVHGGDNVWWDHRDWTAAMRVPAVVGAFPEPFAHGAEGKRYPVRIDCADDASDTCGEVADRLHQAGIDASTTSIGVPAGKEVLRLVVGTWSQVRRDAAARQIEQGPASSGVFARFGPGPTGPELLLLDPLGKVTERIASGAGLVAAARFEEQQPTWVVTGTDAAGLGRAVRLLSARSLRDRFAVASDGVRERALPLQAGTRDASAR